MIDSKPILVTGGLGFIGSNFIRYYHQAHPETVLVNLDKLTYSANPENLKDLAAEPWYHFQEGDILDEVLLQDLTGRFSFQAVVHFAAESHVDRSIRGSREFIRPNSPYSASKASGDLLGRSYFETFRFPTLTGRPCNNYGPYQFPEKFIPLMVTNLLDDQPVPVYGRGENVRDWLFVEDACQAIDLVLERGKIGEAYNIGGESEKRNIDLAQEVLTLLGKGEEWLRYVADRPGHDLRYALSNRKIKDEIGWEPLVTFSEGLARTVRWYQEHPGWWQPLKARLARESQGFWSK